MRQQSTKYRKFKVRLTVFNNGSILTCQQIAIIWKL